jgi:hypothetical protein
MEKLLEITQTVDGKSVKKQYVIRHDQFWHSGELLEKSKILDNPTAYQAEIESILAIQGQNVIVSKEQFDLERSQIQ